ncbi:MAG: hypothetical protein PHF51_02145 [Candidatus ainarchaeum sp.]|nr:hypothetical protein [Candidatus ainarchaeum sp.]
MLSKDDVIKIAVVVIALVFMFEAFAIQGAKNQVPGDGGATPTPTPASSQVLGYAQVEATLSAYPDGVLSISGDGAAGDDALRQRLDSFVASGKAAYYNSADPDGVSLVLDPGADASEIGWNLSSDFPAYGLSARAQLELPGEAVFATRGGNVTAPIRYRGRVLMEPLVPAGENVTVLLTAMLSGDAITELQVEIAQRAATVALEGTVSALSDSWFGSAEVPWEERARLNESEMGSALRAVYPDSSVEYSEWNFVITGNVSEAEKAAIENISYVLFVVGNTTLVEDGFVDRTRAEADFQAALNRSTQIEFPPSDLSVNVTAANASESGIRELVGVPWLLVARKGTLRLNDSIPIGGRTYALPGGASVPAYLPGNASIGDSAARVFTVTVKGAKIITIS